MTSQLVVGALVELVNHPGTYGVLDELNGSVATVRWDLGVDLSPMVELEERQPSAGGAAAHGDATWNGGAWTPSGPRR